MASESKRVVITGAASGIGRALADAYLERGASVALIDRDREALEKYRSSQDPDRVSVHAVDVSKEDEVRAAATAIREKLGRPDIWINNAGIALLGKFEELSAADFEKVMAVDFYGVVYGTRAAFSLMSDPQHGTIVNVSSVNGTVAAPFMSSYVAAKHAVVGFTRSLQLEQDQSQSPVQVILVCPGWVKTPIMSPRAGFSFPAWLEWVVERPEGAAREIIRGIDAGKREIVPTWNGKMIRGAHSWAPRLVESSSRLLTAKNWKEALGLSKIRR